MVSFDGELSPLTLIVSIDINKIDIDIVVIPVI
jgi:hypothetical protein